MNNKQFVSQNDIKIKYPDKFDERYDKSLDCRRYGADNLYPQHLREFAENSPTLNSCINRQSQFLIGKTLPTKLISKKLLKAIINDYSTFGGFSLAISYDGLGDINNILHVPFETIRLGECGNNGIYTYCWCNPDWSGTSTINKKRVDKSNRTKYWIYTTNVETRLIRMNQEDYAGYEILYFSNSLSYPTEKYRSAISYVSAEIGVANVLYRDTRCSFMPSCALAVPRQSDGDTNEFQANLAKLQGDSSSYKILTVEFSSQEDKPEVLPFQQTDYVDRVIKTNETARNTIIRCFGQEGFIRLEDGSLGFGSEAIGEIYNYYNYQLETERLEIQEALQTIDPTFIFEKTNYENLL